MLCQLLKVSYKVLSIRDQRLYFSDDVSRISCLNVLDLPNFAWENVEGKMPVHYTTEGITEFLAVFDHAYKVAVCKTWMIILSCMHCPVTRSENKICKFQRKLYHCLPCEGRDLGQKSSSVSESFLTLRISSILNSLLEYW